MTLLGVSMISLRRSVRSWGLFLWAATAPIFPAAQAQTSAPPTEDPTAQNTGISSPQDPKNPADPPSIDVPGDRDTGLATPSVITVLGGASPLVGSSGTLRWGDLFVRDISFTQIYDHSVYTNIATTPTMVDSSFSDNTSLFQVDVAYNHMTRYGQIALQYRPGLAIVNGSVYPNYSNQNVAFDMVFNQNSRWSYYVHNIFTYLSSQNLYAESYVDANTQTGRAIQNNFLDASGSLLNEGASLIASYKWSPRTSINFTPTYNYLRTTGSQTGTLRSSIYGGAVNVGYQLSPRQTIGAFFNTQYISIVAVQGNTQVYTAGLSYSRVMGPSFVIAGHIGAARNPAYGHQNGSPWTFTGSASLTRGFQYVSLGIVYSRDLAMGYVTNNFADRADGFFAWQIAHPLKWRTSVGAQRESGLTNPIAAYYAINGLDLLLAPRVSTFASYGYRLQSGNSDQILKGHRNFFSVGIRWDSSPAEGSY
jgi:hypothetical protein